MIGTNCNNIGIVREMPTTGAITTITRAWATVRVTPESIRPRTMLEGRMGATRKALR